MTELVVVSAADEAALLAEIARLVAFLDRVPDVPFLDVAYTCSLTRGPARLAVIAADVASLRARLVSARSRIASGAARRIRDKSGTYSSILASTIPWTEEPGGLQSMGSQRVGHD